VSMTWRAISARPHPKGASATVAAAALHTCSNSVASLEEFLESGRAGGEAGGDTVLGRGLHSSTFELNLRQNTPYE